VVFAAGFALGAIRTLWVVPRVGVRYAELMEAPLMLLVTIAAARRVVGRSEGNRLGVGLVGLGLLLAAEVGVAVGVRHLSLVDSIASRDPVSGTVYLLLVAAFAVMPLLVLRESAKPSLLDQFIPHPDVRKRHEIMIDAPAALVFEVACGFDMQSLAIVRALFWLRAKLLGARTATRRPRGLIADILAMGWERLSEEPGRYFVAGAVCQPWKADVVFTAIPPAEFAAFAAPDRVKIAWTIEAEPLGPALTRLATETRVVATDDRARAKFRWYWLRVGIGSVLIRLLLMRAVLRQAESAEIRR